ncbi:MAG: hypothetical protein IH946_11895, partial [Bacteroidetes bacterium]|nr:hypothetical protein [Bacteroidota bacterium]
SGELDNESMPILASLTGNGMIEVLDAVMKNFAPVQKLADVLKLDNLKELEIKKMMTIFEVRDGRVFVEPFDYVVDDIKMNISGSHSFEQELDYKMKMIIPTAKLGSEANQAISGLLGAASDKGIDIKGTDKIAMDILIGGTIDNPTIKTGAKDVGANLVDNLKDQAKEKLVEKKEELVDKGKEEAEKKKKEAEAKAKAEAKKRAEQIVKEAEVKAKQIRSSSKKSAEKVRKEGYAQADKLVKNAKNPVAKIAAKEAAKKLRKESDKKANKIIKEGNTKADKLVNEAKKKAAKIQ